MLTIAATAASRLPIMNVMPNVCLTCMTRLAGKNGDTGSTLDCAIAFTTPT